MQFAPVWVALRRRKAGAILIAVQIAVTLAVLCNTLFIIEQRLSMSTRPTGVREADLIVVPNQWIGSPPDLPARIRADVAALRALPGVAGAYVTNSAPLTNYGGSIPESVRPDQQEPTAMSAAYFTDEQGLPTLGLKLTAGRNFRPDEITDLDPTKPLHPPAVAIVTRALAHRLFPAGNALGQSIFILPGSSTQIIGIVDQLQVPWVNAAGWGSTFSENSSLLPFRLVAQQSIYVIQARPGAMSDVMRSAQRALLELDRNRILGSAYSLQDARATAYQDDRGLAVLLASISTILLIITALGIVGLTSYWVAQRRRHIGIQRALGATRPAVVRYFQTENLLIAGTGAVLGTALAISINLWMISNYEMQRLTGVYLIVGAAIVLVLGQLAAFYPALRAASIPPAIAARGG